jgi:hypothetical protein
MCAHRAPGGARECPTRRYRQTAILPGYSPRMSQRSKQSTENECGHLLRPKHALTSYGVSAPGRIRTCDTGFRRAVLYPLSYGG